MDINKSSDDIIDRSHLSIEERREIIDDVMAALQQKWTDQRKERLAAVTELIKTDKLITTQELIRYYCTACGWRYDFSFIRIPTIVLIAGFDLDQHKLSKDTWKHLQMLNSTGYQPKPYKCPKCSKIKVYERNVIEKSSVVVLLPEIFKHINDLLYS